MTNFADNREVCLQGIAISSGTALSKVCLFNDHRHDHVTAQPAGAVVPEREWERLLAAVESAARQLADLSRTVAERIGPAEAEIFTAQTTILRDAGMLAKIHAAINSTTPASLAVTRVLDAYEARLLELDNEYIRERATDIGEVKRRLLDIMENTRPALMCAGQAHCRKGRDRIIVAGELTPTLTMELDPQHVRGLVTERGGQTSHAAILARALGIPAVTGIKGLHGSITCGTALLLDGNTGLVVINPSPARAAAARRSAPTTTESVPPTAALRVQANITTAADAAAAMAAQAEGIGLYRTEFEFFAANRLLSEDEQYEKYLAVQQALDGRPVTFRLLDIGGDKSAPFFDIQPEANPYLGFRGGRLLLARAGLWRAQARALARVAIHGAVNVLYPMIVDLEQFHALRAMFTEATSDLPRGEIKHGVMLEVPSACLQAAELLTLADFASVGTNDLIQYLFAVDRNNDLVSHDFHPNRTVFWQLLKSIARAARELDRPLTVCGELAGEPAYAAKLMAAGITTVSVSPRMIGAVRRAAMAHTHP